MRTHTQCQKQASRVRLRWHLHFTSRPRFLYVSCFLLFNQKRYHFNKKNTFTSGRLREC